MAISGFGSLSVIVAVPVPFRSVAPTTVVRLSVKVSVSSKTVSPITCTGMVQAGSEGPQVPGAIV